MGDWRGGGGLVTDTGTASCPGRSSNATYYCSMVSSSQYRTSWVLNWFTILLFKMQLALNLAENYIPSSLLGSRYLLGEATLHDLSNGCEGHFIFNFRFEFHFRFVSRSRSCMCAMITLAVIRTGTSRK